MPAKPLVWTTLGTAGGPPVQPDRSQPANMLTVDGRPWLVDAGDGVSERLAGAGLSPDQVDTVFISHLHVDHTAGLLGVIGLRWFTQAPRPLTIYGPPGTDKLVAGLVAALGPAERIGLGIKGSRWGSTVAGTVTVKILTDGSDLMVDGVRVRAVRNSHFADAEGREVESGSQSLSYRFERPGYAIAYTGDTGPSEAVVRLARGANLLVSEVIDLPSISREVAERYPQMPAPVMRELIEHFRTHHLTTAQAGELAASAGVKRLVLTHLTAAGRTASFESRLLSETRSTFRGPVSVAHDLDRF